MNELQFSKFVLNPEYSKNWNNHLNDFIVLTRNGELIRNTLYRLGGLNNPQLNKDKYFLLIKYVEAHYSNDVMKMSKSKDNKHLEGKWCILDINGNEKIEFDGFKHPYLVSNSCIYSMDGKYYNIETGEFYCNTSSSMQSAEYLFLENRFDEDKSKRGVLKINKETGIFELFKE